MRGELVRVRWQEADEGMQEVSDAVMGCGSRSDRGDRGKAEGSGNTRGQGSTGREYLKAGKSP
jgi:hypothetical protein